MLFKRGTNTQLTPLKVINMQLTLEQLQKIMPRVHNPLLNLPFLNKAMEEGGINTKLRIAAFLGIIAEESGELRWLEELWGPTEAQKRYDPPDELAIKLGNTEIRRWRKI